MSSVEKTTTRLPFFVTISGAIALTLMVFNGVRLYTAVAQSDAILEFMPSPGPYYLAVTGLMWFLAWTTVFVSIMFRKERMPLFLLTVSFFYALCYWFERLVFQSVAGRDNTVFALSVTFLFFGVVIIASLQWSSLKNKQRENHDK